jgi:UDP-2,3-diacylglucosamine pyrophosphatase LpxH
MQLPINPMRPREALRDLRGVLSGMAEVVSLVESFASSPDPPEPVAPPPERSLDASLSEARGSSTDAVEALSAGAVQSGGDPAEPLAWASARVGETAGAEAAAAAATGVIRQAGYGPLLEWAAEPDNSEPVQAMEAPPGAEPDLFVVPRRSYVVAKGMERRFGNDYPYLRSALAPRPLVGETSLFRAETVPALAQEQDLMTAMADLSDVHYEAVILPISRVPGVNVIVLAALLLQELLDPMEVLGWIGADINDLPRQGRPNRPEKTRKLPAPGENGAGGKPVKYMIFSDTHREPRQDLKFRISHFHANRSLYLRALRYCERRGYTVIENGDCEELWYEPTFHPARRQSKLDRFKDIRRIHAPVYKKLASLAKEKRYFRSIGNHDSYLWEDPDLRAWRAANQGFPQIHGAFVIPNCKPMDDFWPPANIGLDPDAYKNRASMLVVHGHNFDFWNCDEHNRLGKFITNAVGVPADALDDVVYRFGGLDRQGHPLVELWDVLAEVTPWNNWPPTEVSRRWAEALEYRSLAANVTQDSITFSETFASVLALLMRFGPLSIDTINPLLCIGHTHNPQSRPWIPYLNQFNPWRDKEILGVPVFENVFAWKTRYLNSGTVGWWEDLIWAIEITEKGQPRLVYWAKEDTEPVEMDWELGDEGRPPPDHPLAGFEQWARRYLGDDIAQGWKALSEEVASDSQAASAAESNGPLTGQALTPDADRLRELLPNPQDVPAGAFAELPPQSAAVLAAIAPPGARPRDRFSLAAAALGSRQSPALRGAEPREWPPKVEQSGRGAPPLPASVAHAQRMWPDLMAGAGDDGKAPRIRQVDVVRALFHSYAGRLPFGAGDLIRRAPTWTGL